MQIKALKVFCDVVGRKSFSLAAGENGISQSGASQTVHLLEEHLGVKLIDRSKRPFILTAEGELYYEGCRKLLHRYQTLEEEVRTLHHDVEGRVRVASIYSVGLSHMNQIVREFLTRHPQAKVRLQYQHPDRVYELVEHNQVDLGVVSYPKSSGTISATTWRNEPMGVVCSAEHPLATRSSVELRELDGLDLVSFDDNLQIRSEIDRTLARHSVTVNVVMEFDNIEMLKRAVEINAGLSILPEPTVQAEVHAGALAFVPLADVAMVRPLGIIQRRGGQLGKTAQKFLELLQENSQPVEIAPVPASRLHDRVPAKRNGRAVVPRRAK